MSGVILMTVVYISANVFWHKKIIENKRSYFIYSTIIYLLWLIWYLLYLSTKWVPS